MKQSRLEIRELLNRARKNIFGNAWRLLKNSTRLFDNRQYAIATFLAITAIEEAGKLSVLRLIQGDIFKGLFQNNVSPEFNTQKLIGFLKNHLDKAFQAAVDTLEINAGADRRHGTNPKSKLHRTSGIVLLARSGRWMNIRNSCLYTDIDIGKRCTTAPAHVIGKEHAYYFICMAYEVLFGQAPSGLGSLMEGVSEERRKSFENKCYRELNEFMSRWSKKVDVDRLDFLSYPDELRKEAQSREKRRSARG